MKTIKKLWRKLVASILVLMLGLVTVPYIISYQPNSFAIQRYKESQLTSFGYEYNSEANIHIILVPGGLVSYVAYAPLAYELSRKGYRVSVVEVPLNLAITYPDIIFSVDTSSSKHVFLLGHSLGGVSASLSMQKKPFSGLITLASYPLQPEKIIGNPSFLSILASRDGLLNLEAYEAAISDLDVDEEIIEGGNHAQFGFYGPQANDLEATISTIQQLNQTTNIIDEWIKKNIQP
jgi:hypothetical protein